MSIPAWDSRGVLPPIKPGHNGNSSNRSPYKCSLKDLIDRFGTSPKRVSLLSSFLDYRVTLHSFGITEGFQWLNGSFVQDVENIEGRAPGDIDIVSHFFLPSGYDQQTFFAKFPNASNIIDPNQVKAHFGMDAYPVLLGGEANHSFTRQIAYWYSMWSHRKVDNAWKGFLEIDLAPDNESSHKHFLSNNNLSGGGQP